MKVVVTGGAGFIGANLCRTLLAAPGITEVVALDATAPSNRPATPTQQWCPRSCQRRSPAMPSPCTATAPRPATSPTWARCARTRLRSLFPEAVPVDLEAGLRATIDWFRTGQVALAP